MSTPAARHGFITTLQLIFNVDNYPVLSVIDDGRTVRLDIDAAARAVRRAGGPSGETARVSAARRRQVLDALRRGAVPDAGLDLLAVGLDRFAAGDRRGARRRSSTGGAVFKAVRGEYGSGKTFFARWLAERAKQANLATAEVQISENETPLHRLETVYRRLTERLTTATFPPSALRPVVDAWFYALEEDVLAAGRLDPGRPGGGRPGGGHAAGPAAGRGQPAPRRPSPPRCAATGPRSAPATTAGADAVLAWLGGQPHVAAAARRPPASAATSTTSALSASCRGC